MYNPNRCHSGIRMLSPTFETLQSMLDPRLPTPHPRCPCCVGNAHLAARLTNVQITVDVWVGPKLHGERLRISIAPRLVVDDKAVRESWQQFSARKIMVMDWKAVSAAQAPGGPQHAGRSQWSPQPGGSAHASAPTVDHGCVWPAGSPVRHAPVRPPANPIGPVDAARHSVVSAIVVRTPTSWPRRPKPYAPLRSSWPGWSCAPDLTRPTAPARCLSTNARIILIPARVAPGTRGLWCAGSRVASCSPQVPSKSPRTGCPGFGLRLGETGWRQ